MSPKCGLWGWPQGLKAAFGTDSKTGESESWCLPGFIIIHHCYRNTIRAVLFLLFQICLWTWHIWYFVCDCKVNRKWALTISLHDTDMVEPKLDSSIIQKGGDGERSDPFWNPYTLSLSITTVAWAFLASQDHTGSTPQTILTTVPGLETQGALISKPLHKADPRSAQFNKNRQFLLHSIRPGQSQMHRLTVT